MPAHLEGLAIDELAMGQVRRLRSAGDNRIGVGPIEEHRDNHPAAALGQATSKLSLRANARGETGQHLRRLVGVGNGDYIRYRQHLGRAEQKPLAEDTWEYRPTNRVDP